MYTQITITCPYLIVEKISSFDKKNGEVKVHIPTQALSVLDTKTGKCEIKCFHLRGNDICHIGNNRCPYLFT